MERFVLPDVVRWPALWDLLQKERGVAWTRDEQLALKMTNREAMSLISGLRNAQGAAFPLWYQFAALAYGWDPESDKIDTGEAQRDALYSPDASLELVVALMKSNQDDVSIDRGAFDDRALQGRVITALRQDGAKVSIVPQCRDKRTGKVRVPRPKCDDQGKGPLIKDPVTGVEVNLPCDKPGDCPPVKPVGDPRLRSSTLWLWAAVAGLVIVFAPGLVSGRSVRSSRRGRRT